jgi:hypothetical protein
MSDFGPLSGVKRKLDFGVGRAAFGPNSDIEVEVNVFALRLWRGTSATLLDESRHLACG